MLCSKEFKLLHCACILVEDLDGPNPLFSLAVINLSQIQNRLLDNAIGSATPIFHNRAVVIFLPSFHRVVLRKNMTPTDLRQIFYAVKRVGLHYTLF
jgi:hypothetical protein